MNPQIKWVFGDLWKNWCAERITEEQYFYAKKNKYVKIGGRPYGITISNKYVEVGRTEFERRVDGLRQKNITCDGTAADLAELELAACSYGTGG